SARLTRSGKPPTSWPGPDRNSTSSLSGAAIPTDFPGLAAAKAEEEGQVLNIRPAGSECNACPSVPSSARLISACSERERVSSTTCLRSATTTVSKKDRGG